MFSSTMILNSTMMNVSLWTILVLLLSLYHVDAFLLSQHHSHPRDAHHRALSNTKLQKAIKTTDSSAPPLAHAEILWKLRPPPGTSTYRKILLRLAANAIRFESVIRGVDPPFVLCPKGGQAFLEAYYQAPYDTFPQRIGRFGITTIRGPPARAIDESVEEIYGIDLQGRHVGSAAIIYMCVEPQFRKRNVGALALEVISTIHSIQGCDFTMLVADDDGSGNLIQWYEEHGYSRAPLLQDLLGSPGGEYGVAMIAPTNNEIDVSCRIKWW